MTTKEPQKVETESPEVPAPALAMVDAPHDVVEEKSVIPPADKDKAVGGDTEALAVVEKTPDPGAKKTSKGSIDRDVALAEVEKEKKLSFIKAWEESEKSKVENKTQKKIADVNSWENTQKAKVEAKLKQVEEALEKKKAEYAEIMKNKLALLHKEAEEKRAMIEARRREELLKAEEMAAKHRATGHVPKKTLGCFGG